MAQSLKRLIKASIKRDKKAQSKLYEVCFGFLYPVALRYASCSDDAMSYLNLGFYKVLQKLNTLENPDAFKAWAKRVLIHTILDELKKQKRYQQYVETAEASALENVAPEVEFDDSMGVEEIYAAIRSLPPQTASVFNLYAIDGYKHREIAVMLNISEGTSKWHYAEARKRLRVILSKKAYSEKLAS